MISKDPKKRLGRYCIRCGKRFIPTGRFHKVCFDCMPKPAKLRYLLQLKSKNSKK